MNLITNAVHAMRLKGGVLDITLENVGLDTAAVSGAPDLASGCYLKLTVKDSGHGMDAKTMERIFDPFFTTKGLTEGTGLGLSVVHGIVRSHGGAITVQSAPGCGASFEVLLPRTDHPWQESGVVGGPLNPKGSERILFVDDEEDVAFAGKKMLERLGYEVVVGRDGVDALDIFRADPGGFDLVITDQTMPRMTGTELTRQLLLLRGDLPVILCTGLGPMAEKDLQREEGEVAGIREVVLKPLDREELSIIIRRVLDGCEEG
jgi:CheY-like chemotaxis protein